MVVPPDLRLKNYSEQYRLCEIYTGVIGRRNMSVNSRTWSTHYCVLAATNRNGPAYCPLANDGTSMIGEELPCPSL